MRPSGNNVTANADLSQMETGKLTVSTVKMQILVL